MSLPKRGSFARNKYEEAKLKWKPKPMPKDYQPLSDADKKKLNGWASLGHQGAVHQLLDDYHWKNEEHKDNA